MKTNFGFALALLSIAGAPNLPAQPGTILWSFDTGSQISSSPVLALDGTIYVAALGLCAITNNGSSASNRWTVPVFGSPVLGADGTIYCAAGGALTAVNPDGSQKWTFSGGTTGSGLPALAFDSTVYYFADRDLHAVSASGTGKWSRGIAPSGARVLSPVVGADGVIYVGVNDELFAFNADGTNRWSYRLYGTGIGSLALGTGGTIYAAADQLFAVTRDGINIWSMGREFIGSPIIGKNGTLYLAGRGRALYTVSPSGQALWYTLTNAPMYGAYTAPAIDAGGRIYYCVSNTVWALNPQGEIQWSLSASNIPDPRIDVASTSPIIGPDGTLYATLGTTLYAIATGTNGPANSPWPMDRQNVRHTGKAEKAALQSPKKRADANFEFQLFSQVGQNVSIESSTNASAWNVMTSMVPTAVPEPVVDLTASNSPVKFYRAKGGG